MYTNPLIFLFLFLEAKKTKGQREGLKSAFNFDLRLVSCQLVT